jgi:hypothetical protein
MTYLVSNILYLGDPLDRAERCFDRFLGGIAMVNARVQIYSLWYTCMTSTKV